MYNQFKPVALEFYGKGFQVTNAPTSQPLGRTPWGGRLVETLGQDPYLNGIAFGLGAEAFSDAGIVAGGKHFLLNEQETNRTAQGGSSSVAPYSSVVDDKALHETYLWSVPPFRTLIITFMPRSLKRVTLLTPLIVIEIQACGSNNRSYNR
jgi:beta-glucosidase